MRFNKAKSINSMVIKIYSRSIFRWSFLLGFPAGILCLNLFFAPQTMEQVQGLAEGSPLLCWFHLLTGFLCPGCGMTRSVLSFFTGHFIWSFYFNPFGPVLSVGVASYWMLKLLRVGNLNTRLLFSRVAPYSLVLVLVWGILRNIP